MTARHWRGSTGVPLLQTNTAVPLPPQVLYFLCKVWCPFERMPCQSMSASNKVQPSVHPCCACGHYLTAVAGCFHLRHCATSLLRKHLLSATTQWAAGTACATARTCALVFLGRHLLFLLCTCTCLEGRRAGRRSGPQICFQNQITVWGEMGHLFLRKKIGGMSYKGSF